MLGPSLRMRKKLEYPPGDRTRQYLGCFRLEIAPEKPKVTKSW